MKPGIGFHTNAFVWAGVNDIERIASFGAQSGFDFLEVGPGIPLDISAFEKAGRIIPAKAFIYARNFIDDNKHKAGQEKSELFRRIEFAGSLGVKKVICSTGISRELSLPESGGSNPLLSLERAAEFLREAAEFAEKFGVMLCLENCPMYRNIATSPYMWRKIFEAVSLRNLGLCYDASHFVWQFIDVYKPLTEFGDRIHHIHIKDTALFKDKLSEVGILHNTARERGFEENQWWRHTVICEGEIDWDRFFRLSGSISSPYFDFSFEMEDYKFECVPERVEEGLKIQISRYKKFVPLFWG